MRSKLPELERALTGRVREHHRFLIANHLAQIDFLGEQIAVFDAEIAQRIEPPEPPQDQTDPVDQPPPADTQGSTAPLSWEAAVALLDTIPGIGQRAAEQILAEIGPDMSRFPTEAHIASGARLSPGNNESAGKRYSGRTGHGTGFCARAWSRPPTLLYGSKTRTSSRSTIA